MPQEPERFSSENMFDIHKLAHNLRTEQSPNQSLIYCFNCKGSSSISRFIVSHSRGSPKNAKTFSYDAHKMISWLTFSNLWRVILLEPVVVLFGINANTTTLQSMINAKLSKQRFWHCYESGLIKTIQTIPYITTYMWVSSWLPFTVD